MEFCDFEYNARAIIEYNKEVPGREFYYELRINKSRFESNVNRISY